MTTPLHSQETVAEALRNSLQIASAWAEGQPPLTAQAFVRIAQLIRHALEQLSEPNAAAIKVARELDDDGFLTDRYYRDTVAAILKAQLTGNVS